MLNALTIDVEDYFHVSAFEKCISCDEWEDMPRRVEANTNRVMDILDECALKATFFVLGWVAERHPELVRRMSKEGHEVCCHGFSHQRITAMTQQEFADDLDRSKKLLQDLSGQEVAGYRAPSYTITARTIWALDTLVEAGFKYDSSIFPIHHDIYGMPDADRFIHRIQRESGSLLEFPPTTFQLKLPGKELNLPVSGGGYLRLLPVSWISAAFKKTNGFGHPCVLYFHPWEIDPGQPRIKAPLKSRFRHYLNLARTESKLRSLFGAHSFAPMRQVFDEVMPDA